MAIPGQNLFTHFLSWISFICVRQHDELLKNNSFSVVMPEKKNEQKIYFNSYEKWSCLEGTPFLKLAEKVLWAEKIQKKVSFKVYSSRARETHTEGKWDVTGQQVKKNRCCLKTNHQKTFNFKLTDSTIIV